MRAQTWKFLDGKKTVLGILGTLATVAISSGGQPAQIAMTGVEIVGHVDSILTGGFMLLTILGVVHKGAKR